jgi:hypothetical protein
MGFKRLQRAWLTVFVLSGCVASQPDVHRAPEVVPKQRGAVSEIPLPVPVFLDILTRRGIRFETGDMLAVRVVSAFGAIFAAEGNVTVPEVWMFPDEKAVSAFQEEIVVDGSSKRGSSIQLQKSALSEFEAARREANGAGSSITPAGPFAARRSYHGTVDLWNSRLLPGLRYWVDSGRLQQRDADRVLALDTRDQIEAVLKLEERGLWFSLDHKKSILYSVAAPGTSQHLSMLALDVEEHDTPAVRSILVRHGWYQTVYSDLPHFTFLGVPESRLPGMGLEARKNAGRTFWVVQVPKSRGADVELEIGDTCAF